MLTCDDGWKLQGEVLTPKNPRAAAIVGHAMMVDRRTLRQLVAHLVAQEIAVIWFDLRGHGESGPTAAEGGRWCYDDLVDDVPQLIAFARERFPQLPLMVVGHSLFGHATLAHLTRHPETRLDKLVVLACNYVHPEWNWRALTDKGAPILLMSAITRAVGYFPARRMRLGTADEAAPYVYDFLRSIRVRDWQGRDGFSYAEHRSRVKTPILAIAGADDRLLAPPHEARSLLSGCSDVQFHIERGTHMSLVKNPAALARVASAL
jgi:predicted alpha/beta hydrolase